MYRIKQASQLTGVSSDAIRYYERAGVLPPPRRAENGYRLYADDDLQRLRFIRQARLLDLSLEAIAEILAFRDQGILPCDYVLELIEDKIEEVHTRIRELETLRGELADLHETGKRLPNDEPESCICGVIQARDRTA